VAAKKTKAAVDYRRATDVRNCHNCASMNADGTCKKVLGIVKPHDVCDLWTRAHS
jgi:hypothetical protein